MNKKVVIGLCIGAIAVVGIIGAIIFRNISINQEKTKSLKNAENEVFTPPPTVTQSPLIKMGAVETSSVLLSIVSPLDKTITNTQTIVVKGKTVPKGEVMVNDKETTADANGNFSVSYGLEEGENPIMIVANDEEGNASEFEMTITYEPK